MNDSILKFFQEAVDCIPCDIKQAYFDALECAPDVVADETDPINYILFDRFNAWAAANRIIKYWHWKKRLFGDRMFLRLHDLSGAGALDEEDVSYLYTGYAANLPPQKDGISVILGDRSRVDWDSMDPKRHLRITLFCMSIAAKEQSLRKRRFVIALNIVTSMPNTKNTHNHKDLADVVQCIPIQVKCIRTLLVTRIALADYFLKSVAPVVANYTREMMTKVFESIEVVYSHESIRERLEAYELQPEGVPVALGGSWDYRSYFDMLTSLRNMTNVSTYSKCFDYHGNRSLLSVRWDGRPANIIRSPIPKAVQAIRNLCPNSDLMNNLNGGGTVVLPATTYPIDHARQMCFLRHNNFDLQRFAYHTNLYLEVRTRLFAERAILPMNQLDGGALNDEDRMTLSTGFILIAPKIKGNNLVVAFEPRRATGQSVCSQRRCFFYVLHVILEQIKTGKEKLVILLVLSNVESSQFHNIAVYADVAKAFPIELSYLHVFLEPIGLGWLEYKSSVDDLLTRFLDVNQDQIVRHTIPGYMKPLSSLYDLKSKHLPVSIGGKLKAEDFHRWQAERLQIEWQSKLQEQHYVLPMLLKSPNYSGPIFSTEITTPVDNDQDVKTIIHRHSIHESSQSLKQLPCIDPNRQSVSTNVDTTLPYMEPHLSPELEQVHQSSAASGLQLAQHRTQYFAVPNHKVTDRDVIPSTTWCFRLHDDEEVSIMNCLEMDTDSIFSINTQLFDDDDTKLRKGVRKTSHIGEIIVCKKQTF